MLLNVTRTLVVAIICSVHAVVASAQTTDRPIQDFVGPSLNYGNFLWYDSSLPEEEQVHVVFDLFGRMNAINSVNAGTSLDGQITETALPDGTARVRVVMRGTNVLTWAYRNYNNFGPLVFGHHPADAATKADPALASTLLTIEFINSAVGAPLPAFVELFQPELGYRVEKLLVEGSATGTLRAAFGVAEGTRGRVHAAQRALFGVAGMPVDDQYPAENVSIKAVGGR